MKKCDLDFPPLQSTSSGRLARMRERITLIRQQVNEHPLYNKLSTIEDLRTFLESHVFAVWDFMSLLKELQRVFSCVTVPWVPSPFPKCRRLVNEIVLGEESDDFNGTYVSHFELYRLAMQEASANTLPLETFLSELNNGSSVSSALVAAVVPEEAALFVESTFSTIRRGKPHTIAAAFTFGREDLIPGMFRSIVSDLNRSLPGQLRTLLFYLERHIDVDGDTHGPMALQMISDLCADNDTLWDEAMEAAVQALEARLALWTGILDRITNQQGYGSLSVGWGTSRQSNGLLRDESQV